MTNQGLRRLSSLLVICLFLAVFGYFYLFSKYIMTTTSSIRGRLSVLRLKRVLKLGRICCYYS